MIPQKKLLIGAPITRTRYLVPGSIHQLLNALDGMHSSAVLSLFCLLFLVKSQLQLGVTHYSSEASF